jgi:hypothetical protein
MVYCTLRGNVETLKGKLKMNEDLEIGFESDIK